MASVSGAKSDGGLYTLCLLDICALLGKWFITVMHNMDLPL